MGGSSDRRSYDGFSGGNVDSKIEVSWLVVSLGSEVGFPMGLSSDVMIVSNAAVVVAAVEAARYSASI